MTTTTADSSRSARRTRRIALCSVLLAILAAIVWNGATAAFHFLPLALTGEDERLAAALHIERGDAVADIGAGRGRMAKAIARRIAPGVLYATEIDEDRLEDLRSLDEPNISVIKGRETETGLPDACCDAIYLRNVYHHLSDPDAFNRDLRRALRPGGRLGVIDFGPHDMPHLEKAPSGARGTSGHGVAAQDVTRELQSAGFTLERFERDWGGRTYLVVVRAPN